MAISTIVASLVSPSATGLAQTLASLHGTGGAGRSSLLVSWITSGAFAAAAVCAPFPHFPLFTMRLFAKPFLFQPEDGFLLTGIVLVVWSGVYGRTIVAPLGLDRKS